MIELTIWIFKQTGEVFCWEVNFKPRKSPNGINSIGFIDSFWLLHFV